MGSWLEPMVAHRVPLFLSVERGANWDIVYALLAEFPDLVCVICDHGCWGEDRRFRPVIERYPHVYVDTAQYLLDGGIEAFVADYGPGRMLFGSGFPGLALRRDDAGAPACPHLGRGQGGHRRQEPGTDPGGGALMIGNFAFGA